MNTTFLIRKLRMLSGLEHILILKFLALYRVIKKKTNQKCCLLLKITMNFAEIEKLFSRLTTAHR
jgi:hypothetical protein